MAHVKIVEDMQWVCNFLQQLVNQNSWTMNISGVQAVQEMILSEADSLGLQVSRLPVPERGDMLVISTASVSS
jgi:hypothetical protein